MNALYFNTTSNTNTASGHNSLRSYMTGVENSAFGQHAAHNSTGNNYITLGFQAGLHVTTGSGNIEIGNVGAASDNNMIKIGTEGTQAKTFISGI